MSDHFLNTILLYGIHGSYMTLNVLKEFSIFFTRGIYKRLDITTMSYPDHLTNLGLHSLEYRRVYFDLVMWFEIVKNLVYLDASAFFNINVSPYYTKG